MTTQHFLLGIDFAGGTEFTVNFANHPDVTDVENAVARENIDGSVISTGGGGYIIRTPPLSQPAQQTTSRTTCQKALGPMTAAADARGGRHDRRARRSSSPCSPWCSPSAGILLLLAIRFRNVPGGWRAGFQFGGSALAALLHDVFLLTGLFSILGAVSTCGSARSTASSSPPC